jgi:hypothetical protein
MTIHILLSVPPWQSSLTWCSEVFGSMIAIASFEQHIPTQLSFLIFGHSALIIIKFHKNKYNL